MERILKKLNNQLTKCTNLSMRTKFGDGKYPDEILETAKDIRFGFSGISINSNQGYKTLDLLVKNQSSRRLIEYLENRGINPTELTESDASVISMKCDSFAIKTAIIGLINWTNGPIIGFETV